MRDVTRTLAHRAFGPVARKFVTDDGQLAKSLFQAAIPKRAENYLAECLAWSLAVLGGGVAIVGLLAVASRGALPPTTLLLLGFLLTLIPTSLTVTVFLLSPVLRVGERRREIDANLPHGLNYLMALAASGLAPRLLFRSLARQKVYGALAEECELISRDLDILGMDILTALRGAQERTPSEKFKEFLQGAISAFSSGVDLEVYLKTKGEQYTREEIESQRQSLDVIGLMAETFLVAVVAAPLFLLVLLAVMSLNQGEQVIMYGYFVSLAYLPMSQFMIAFVVQSLNPRVWS